MDSINHVRDFCLENQLIEEGCRVLLAVSGGPDSIALFHIFCTLSADLKIELAVAHLNHGLRGNDSDRDQLFVEKTARSACINYYTQNVKVAEARKKGESLEEAARRIRYRFLFSTLKKIGYTYIATGHTLDDNVETIIYRLITGTGPSGFTGISPKSHFIIHPLLTLTKEQIIYYLTENNLRYRTDRTNYDTTIPRNKIRHVIIPQLYSINRLFKEHLLHFSQIIRQENDLIDSIVDKAIHEILIEKTDTIIEVDYPRLYHLENAVKRRVIIKLCGLLTLEDHTTRKMYLPFKVLDGLFRERIRGNKVLYQNNSFILQKEYDQLLFKKNLVDTGLKRYLYTIDAVESSLYIKEIGKKIVFSVTDRVNNFDRNKLYFDYSKIAFPFYIRSRHRGDRIVLKNTGTKKLKTLFIDHKVPVALRDPVPVVECGKDIIGVFCSLYGKVNRVAESHMITKETNTILVCELCE